MKNCIFLLVAIITLICSCGGYVASDDQKEVKDSLGYEKIVGTYVFKPTALQAERLKIDPNETITLRITADSLSMKSGRYKGKYHIDKMILMLNSYSKEAFSATWSYHFDRSFGYNRFELTQPVRTEHNLDYRIERSSDNDTLHIAGYANDPEYEIMRIVDFKKIR